MVWVLFVILICFLCTVAMLIDSVSSNHPLVVARIKQLINSYKIKINASQLRDLNVGIVDVGNQPMLPDQMLDEDGYMLPSLQSFIEEIAQDALVSGGFLIVDNHTGQLSVPLDVPDIFLPMEAAGPSTLPPANGAQLDIVF